MSLDDIFPHRCLKKVTIQCLNFAEKSAKERRTCSVESLLDRDFICKTRFILNETTIETRTQFDHPKLCRQNQTLRVYLSVLFNGRYLAGLKDIYEAKTFPLNTILLRQRCWIEEKTRLLDLPCLKLTGPTLKNH